MKDIGKRNNMEEWKEYKLKDIIQFNPSEKIPKGTKCRKIGMDQLSPFCRYVHSNNFDLYKGGSKFRNGDVIMARITPCLENGKTAYVSSLSDDEVAFGSTEFIVMRNIENKSDSKFIYYLSISPAIRDIAIKSMIGSSGRQRVQQDVLENFKMDLPSSLNDQRRIANMLSSLDDKIELNNHINANLEEQAQTLFRRWFVDFEFPNEEGLPYKSNGGAFVDSELGKIPKGWKVGTISEIIESTLGGDWGKESKEGNYTREVFCIRGADIPDIKKGTRGKMPIRYILEKNFLNKSLESEDLVVEISGGSPTQSTGRVCKISTELLSNYKNSLICTNFCRAIKPTVGFSSYIFYLWEYLYSQGVMFTYENGTTGIKNLDMNRLTQKELIVIPNKDILKEFSILVNTINKIIQSNGKESENLSNLRDSLLPQLMNNQIKI
jgi:type I restriction enzyme, S subunit